MKTIRIQLLLGLFLVSLARADMPLTIGQTDLSGNNGPCWDSTIGGTQAGFSKFSLAECSGTGLLVFSTARVIENSLPRYVYYYAIDLSGVSASTAHCVKLLVHFGAPLSCTFNVLVDDSQTNNVNVSSATLFPFGDVTLAFGSGCLAPGQKTSQFAMVSDIGSKLGTVTLIDDYVDPASGLTNEYQTNVTAYVPNVPPGLTYLTPPVSLIHYQGVLYTNPAPQPPPLSGSFDFSLQLFDAPSNGLALSQMTTQTVQTAGGIFDLPLPFDPASYGSGAPSWLSIGVRPSGAPNTPFTMLNPPTPNLPTPQAFYASSAGSVNSLMPGQAVTTLNGLTGELMLVASTGIVLDTNGPALTISAQSGGSSDRNLKTNLQPVDPRAVLARLAAMPIESWRFTNEAAGIRHVGPMAQDFRAAFGLGSGDKVIGYLDASGVALAAIQGLNQKLVAGFQGEDIRNEELQQEIKNTKQLMNEINQKLNGGAK